MAILRDKHLLHLFGIALAEWNCDGFIAWRQRPAEWLDANIGGHTTKSVAKLMNDHFRSGGKIDQVRERRKEFASHHEFHFDFRISVDDRRIYIETVLDETRTGPTITVVSMHDE